MVGSFTALLKWGTPHLFTKPFRVVFLMGKARDTHESLSNICGESAVCIPCPPPDPVAMTSCLLFIKFITILKSMHFFLLKFNEIKVATKKDINYINIAKL